MTEEEGSSNSDLELKLNQSNYLIKLQNDFNNLQIKLIEEKENSLNLEKKNFLLENKLKEKEIEQTFKQLLDKKMKEVENNFLILKEKNKEMNENFQKIKSDNEQKDEKINLLEEEIKKIAHLSIEMEQLKTIIYTDLNFIKINNRCKIDIDYYKCCENKCINTNNPIGNCIEGNGFVNLINDGNIEYIKCVEGKGVNKDSLIITENSFKKPQNCINYSLFYFEIKCTKMGGVKNHKMFIGLKIDAYCKYIKFGAAFASIYNEEVKGFKLLKFSWNNNDVFGCGLIYPPEGFPYIFFTQNGKQIGKAVLIKDNNESFNPFILLKCCSVETNFGNNLENIPFVYDISKHLVPKYY